MWARAANWTFLVFCRDRAGDFGRDADEGEPGVLQTSNDWVCRIWRRGGIRNWAEFSRQSKQNFRQPLHLLGPRLERHTLLPGLACWLAV